MKTALRAECLDCPTTRNADWGHDERVFKEAVDETIVRAWAWRHVYDKEAVHAGTYGHRLKFLRVARMSIDVEKLDPDLLQRIFGES